MPRARVGAAAVVIMLSIAVVGAAVVSGRAHRPPIGNWADAVTTSDTRLARALAAAGVDPETPRVNGLTPLMRAANRDDAAMVKILLAAGADVEAADPEGHTAAHIAARANATDALATLLSVGADVDASSRNGMAAIHHAAESNAVDTLRLLAGHGVDVDIPSEVISQGHGYPRDVGAPPLGIAARAGRIAGVQALLELGADVDARSGSGHTPLLLAVFSNRSDVVRLLLEAGADRTVVAPCDAGCSGEPADAAGWARRLGRTDVVPLLVP